MKTIKIFLASSEELDYDRMAFGNLIRKLDKIYEKRGIRIELFEWEDYDAAFNGVRKQDEYNENIRNSDMFLALFYKKAGKFTIEEFNVATEEFKKHASPKVYTYCKDLQPGEEESPELKEFKKRLFEELGHYWCRYDNNDTMQLHFVMQLQLVENSQSDALKVENGEVTLDGHHIASMDKLKFASANEDYVRMNERLASLSKDIEGLRMTLLQLPDNEFLNNSLQEKLNEYNKLKEEFAKYQELLFSTAKRIAQMQGECITKDIRSAMDAFNEGKVREAIFILDRTLANDELEFEDFKQSKEIMEMKRQNIIRSIEANHFRASVIMTDVSLPIEERITQAKKNYANADERAKEADYDKEKYIKLLADYGNFLREYAFYAEAMKVDQRVITLSEEQFGKEHPKTAALYNDIGLVYSSLGDYSKALEYYSKALEIREKELGKEHLATAMSYGNIGNVYYHQGNYPKALEYYLKALEIKEKVLGKEHPAMAISYNNFGKFYHCQGDYPKALEYYSKALEINEKELGKDHPSTAGSYNNIGCVYISQGNYQKALEYHFKALDIQEKVLGKEHPYTATLYFNIGVAYHRLKNYPKALEYDLKALSIHEKVFGKEHPFTMKSYNVIGLDYCRLKDYPHALEYYLKVLSIREEVIGKDHLNTALSSNNVGAVYRELGQYDKALEYIGTALEIAMKLKNNKLVATFHNRLGRVYALMGDKNAAREHFQQAIDLLPENHKEALDSKERMKTL